MPKPPAVDWYYHRNNCTSCSRSASFLDARRVEVGEKVIANKVRFERAAALRMARAADAVVVARGTKLVRFRMADAPSDAELAEVILGPSGKLRAPAVRVGKTLVIGFHPDAYAELFG